MGNRIDRKHYVENYFDNVFKWLINMNAMQNGQKFDLIHNNKIITYDACETFDTFYVETQRQTIIMQFNVNHQSWRSSLEKGEHMNLTLCSYSRKHDETKQNKNEQQQRQRQQQKTC